MAKNKKDVGQRAVDLLRKIVRETIWHDWQEFVRDGVLPIKMPEDYINEATEILDEVRDTRLIAVGVILHIIKNHKCKVRVRVPAIDCYMTVTKQNAIDMLKVRNPEDKVFANHEMLKDEQEYLFIG